jgi:hypothetical protein
MTDTKSCGEIRRFVVGMTFDVFIAVSSQVNPQPSADRLLLRRSRHLAEVHEQLALSGLAGGAETGVVAATRTRRIVVAQTRQGSPARPRTLRKSRTFTSMGWLPREPDRAIRARSPP